MDNAKYAKGSETLHPDEDNWKIAMLTALLPTGPKSPSLVFLSGQVLMQ